MQRTLVLATTFAALVAWTALSADLARAERAITLDWGDLIPQEAAPDPVREMSERFGLTDEDRRLSTPRGVVGHGALGTIAGGTEVVTKYNGKTVTLSGFVIPLDYTAEGVGSFMLVPFVGACIHVPPPPPNQLVYVTAAEPVMVEAVFEPFTVTGEFGTATTRTDLAEVGYVLQADTVERYGRR